MVAALQKTHICMRNDGRERRSRLRRRPSSAKLERRAGPNMVSCFVNYKNFHFLRKILIVMAIAFAWETPAFTFRLPSLLVWGFSPCCQRKSYGFSFNFDDSRNSPTGRALSVSTSDAAVRKPFHQYTVKELRDLVRDAASSANFTDERPIVWSQFKRKQDYIDYLESQHQTEEILTELPVRIAPSSAPLPKMPPASSSYTSPKDVVFELVYQRYPPIRPSSLDAGGASVPPPQLDVRQEYHPVMRHLARIHGSAPFLEEKGGEASSVAPVQADMDIVCVGTASCTPGTTRGVSCTAVRMNWNRRSATAEADGSSSSTFQSGTWLFDVGECTQVRWPSQCSMRLEENPRKGRD
jgi:hypothetical protein